MAEYDYEGWNADPYTGREFHGVWGDFDVKITLDKSFTVAASGYLQNADDIGHGYSDRKKAKTKKEKLPGTMSRLMCTISLGLPTQNTFTIPIQGLTMLPYTSFTRTTRDHRKLEKASAHYRQTNGIFQRKSWALPLQTILGCSRRRWREWSTPCSPSLQETVNSVLWWV